MKSLRLTLGSFAAISMIFLLTGCDLFQKADNITLEKDFVLNWSADEQTVINGDVPYSKTETVNLADNAEIAKYLNKIKEIEVVSIKYHVENYSADGAVFFKNGIASFASTTASGTAVSVPYAANADGVNLQTATADAALNIDADGLSKIANIFKTEKSLSFTSAGVLSKTPVAFKVVSTFKLKITAEAL
jgi:hypothetical protein